MRNKYARKEQSELLDLFKAFNEIKAVANLFFFYKRHIFLHTCELCSGLPSNVSNVINLKGGICFYFDTQKNKRIMVIISYVYVW